MQLKILLIILLLLVPLSVFAERQNLDEAMARKSRYGQTFFKGLGAGSGNYIWQPETLSWTDINHSTQVWRLVWKPATSDVYSKEYSTNAWSHDGSRIGFFNYNPNEDKI